jgi:hypothetical protein
MGRQGHWHRGLYVGRLVRVVKVFVVVFGIAGVVGVSQLLVRPLIEPWLKDYMNVDYASGLAFIIMSIALYILLYLWTEKHYLALPTLRRQ